MKAFIHEAQRADAEIEATGEVYAAADVHRWLDELARGCNAQRPSATRPAYPPLNPPS